MEPLYMLFLDYCDLSNERKINEASVIFAQAELYCKENGVEMTPGWFIRKKKIDQG